jgi:hypothetical protein
MGAPTCWITADSEVPPYPRGKGGRGGALVGVLEGDSTGGPWPARGGPEGWPTLVVLAGESESLAALRGHMECKQQSELISCFPFERAVLLPKQPRVVPSLARNS